MFTKSETETKLDAEINSLLAKLKETTKETEEYGTLVDRISKLHKLKIEENGTTIDNIVKMHEMESKNNRFKPVSLDTALIVGANIFGILWLTRYEKENVINSKALGFVMKPR
jgi:predicted RNase H-like nuclease (RuvC/YqgF family)